MGDRTGIHEARFVASLLKFKGSGDAENARPDYNDIKHANTESMI